MLIESVKNNALVPYTTNPLKKSHYAARPVNRRSHLPATRQWNQFH